MNKNLQIHVRVTPATRQQWDELCYNSDLNTQSALFRRMVTEIYKENEMNLNKNESDVTKLP